MKRWLHRLQRLLAVLATLFSVVIGAGIATLRQRHHAAPAPAPQPPSAETGPATVADIQPEEIRVEGVEIHLPAPSVWPVILAFGIMLLFFGVVTNLGFAVIGAIMLVWALGGWLKELYRGE